MNSRTRIQLVRRRSSAASHRRQRHGFALPLVLIVLALMVQAAYQLNESMLESARKATVQVHGARASEAALSGVRLTAAWLQAARSPNPRRPLDPSLFLGPHSLPTQDDASTHFYLPAAPWTGADFGVEDESSKLNLLTLPLEIEEQDRAREMLLHIPRMTMQIADAILDWLDADDSPRKFGAEQSYYATQGRQPPHNGRLESLDELLLIRGITPELIYGADRNRNGLLDADEETGSPQVDLGWVRYLTVTARESNQRNDGSPKIYLNLDDAAKLFDLLEVRLDTEQALFIAALRRFGPIEETSIRPEAVSPEKVKAAADERAAMQLAQGDENTTGPRKDQEPAIRAGLDLSGRVAYRIQSLADLCGSKVRIRRKDQDEVLASPWSADAAGVRRVFQQLAEEVTPYAGSAVEGRINVHAAPWQVLACVPGLLPATAQAIELRRQRLFPSGAPAARPSAPLWLLEQGLLDWPTFRDALPYLTSQGDVFTVRCVGIAAAGTAAEYVLATVDASTATADLVYRTALPSTFLRHPLAPSPRSS